jgi:probable HAF family extracellular repeat protein
VILRPAAVLAVLVLAFSSSEPIVAAPSYNVIDLGAISGNSPGEAFSVNEAGQVTGWSGDSCFFYANGTMTSIGTLGGYNCAAWSINSSGHITGDSDTAGGGYPRAFIYSNGTMTSLGTFPDGVSSYGNAINDKDEVAGWAYTAEHAEHAFLYRDGKMNDLGTLDGYRQSYGKGINNLGHVVGTSYAEDGRQSAFLYDGQQMINLNDRIDPGLHWTFYYASAVNDNGQIAGVAAIDGKDHAIIYDNGIATDLGLLPGGQFADPWGMNLAGEVVGYCQTTSGVHGFLYSNGSMTDINSLIDPASGWNLFVARDINDAGWIVGSGIRDGIQRAFMMVPVPEPSTMLLLTIAATSLFLARRRRKRT